MEKKRVLVINPGSTGTKLALFTEEGKEEEEIVGSSTGGAGGILDQLPGRLESVREFLDRQGEPSLSAVVGRGGLVKPVPSGTLIVNEEMRKDAREGYQGEHVSNLGCLIAWELANERGIPAYVVDPVAVDEMIPVARYSGLPQIQRQALSHALNLHAAARKACEKIGKKLKDSRFVVAHMGGGFSIVPMKEGRILDTNNANSGGPFSPTRAGTLPTQPLIKMCFSGDYTLQDMKALTTKKGGLLAYIGTDNAKEVERRALDGEKESAEVLEAMIYQTAKEIGAMATVLSGKLDGVVLTGGLAFSDYFCQKLEERVGFLAPVFRFSGEFEMEALAGGAFRVLAGEEEAIDYPGGTS